MDSTLFFMILSINFIKIIWVWGKKISLPVYWKFGQIKNYCWQTFNIIWPVNLPWKQGSQGASEYNEFIFGLMLTTLFGGQFLKQLKMANVKTVIVHKFLRVDVVQSLNVNYTRSRRCCRSKIFEMWIFSSIWRLIKISIEPKKHVKSPTCVVTRS